MNQSCRSRAISGIDHNNHKLMNQILLSFLCGAAFIGGAVAMTVLVMLVNLFRTKKDRDELFGYWRSSISKHGEQISVLERIADALEEKSKDCK